jgi:transposase
MELTYLYKEWHFMYMSHSHERLTLYLASTKKSSRCPTCDGLSHRVHSRYWRTTRDLPISLYEVKVHLLVQKFFCDQISCPQRIFVQRCSGFLKPYSRRTERLNEIFMHLAFSMSAEGASKFASVFSVPSSPDSFLYLIRQTSVKVQADKRIIGIDDWAIRKGQRYGSLVCDLVHHRPIALLPDRTVSTVSEWLKQHPQIKVVSRDGSYEFAKAIKLGCESAIQIMDRWHLLRNLSDKLEGYVKRCFPKKISIPSSPEEQLNQRETSSQDQPLSEKEQQKWQLIQQAQALYQEGRKKADVMRMLNIDRKTLNKYLVTDKPAIRSWQRVNSLDPYRSIIEEHCQKGTTVPVLFSILKKEGYKKSFSNLSDYVAKIRKTISKEKPSHQTVSPFQLIKWMWRWPERLRTKEKQTLISVLDKYSEANKMYKLTQSFRQIIQQNRDITLLSSWIEDAKNSSIHELKAFATYLSNDIEAVKNCLLFKWSNGLLEGQINRLKVIKRQMYGRANFDLLSKKVLYQF